MARYAMFLRGMNLGNRRIKNEELISCIQELGFQDVAAFLASGNLTFDAEGPPRHLEDQIERHLAQRLSYAVPTFVRRADQVRRIAENNPFAGRRPQRKSGKQQVAFLKKPVSEALHQRLEEFDVPDDWLVASDSELYWWPRGGISQSELDLKGLERLLGPMTIRTQNTLQRLVSKYF